MLTLIRTIHTVVWAFFVGVILAMPVLGWYGHFGWACAAAGLICVEGVILMANRGRCPLTNLAARYVDDRRPNFDIYLPQWLAKYNKVIFTTLFLLGGAFVLWRWAAAQG
ncbi:MAG: hypothetical protein H6839_03895 [Planctomycetes bacterium]|nr:hypothetical protein [Planctomycetota bacterium]